MTVKRVGDRLYGLKTLDVVVRQQPEGMVVQSVHRSLGAARRQAERLVRLSGVAVYAALPLAGNPHRRYRPGDVLDPEDVAWRRLRPAQACSECCDNYRPDSLAYRCPGTRGNPPCDTVAAAVSSPHPPFTAPPAGEGCG